MATDVLFSPSAGGFFLPGLNPVIPGDAVPVSAAEHAALIAGQASGRVIVIGNDGFPALADPPQPSAEAALQAERARMVVSRFQARAALHIAGLLAQAEAAVAAADPLTQMAWADAQEFRRNSPTIAALSASIGLTPEQVDDLFRSATQIVA